MKSRNRYIRRQNLLSLVLELFALQLFDSAQKLAAQIFLHCQTTDSCISSKMGQVLSMIQIVTLIITAAAVFRDKNRKHSVNICCRWRSAVGPRWHVPRRVTGRFRRLQRPQVCRHGPRRAIGEGERVGRGGGLSVELVTAQLQLCK